jgi:hypothetical protein
VPLQAAVYRGLTNKTGPGQLDSPKSLSLPPSSLPPACRECRSKKSKIRGNANIQAPACVPCGTTNNVASSPSRRAASTIAGISRCVLPEGPLGSELGATLHWRARRALHARRGCECVRPAVIGSRWRLRVCALCAARPTHRGSSTSTAWLGSGDADGFRPTAAVLYAVMCVYKHRSTADCSKWS